MTAKGNKGKGAQGTRPGREHEPQVIDIGLQLLGENGGEGIGPVGAAVGPERCEGGRYGVECLVSSVTWRGAAYGVLLAQPGMQGAFYGGTCSRLPAALGSNKPRLLDPVNSPWCQGAIAAYRGFLLGVVLPA